MNFFLEQIKQTTNFMGKSSDFVVLGFVKTCDEQTRCRIRTTSSGSNDFSAEPIIAPDHVIENDNSENEDIVPQVAKVIVVDPKQSNTEVSYNS